MTYVVATFYQFTRLDRLEEMKRSLLSMMHALTIKGTIILASEGINGTICSPISNMDTFIAFLKNSHLDFNALHFKKTYSQWNVFDKAKIKLRQEIVTLGISHIDPQTMTGEYVHPSDWNQLISDKEVITVDTRNHYEVELGTFKGALNPNIINFRDFPTFVAEQLKDHKNKKIAMFCTGGIRCEKSTAYLKDHGFKEVYQLQGGILNYLETIDESHSLWEGACFVFDNRVAVDGRLNALERGTIDPEWKNTITHISRQEGLKT